MRTLYVLGFAWLAIAGFSLFTATAPPTVLRHTAVGTTTFSGSGGAWFQRIRAHCNPVEVDVLIQRNPPPDGTQGTGYAAACLALAGRIDDARTRIRTLSNDEQWRAAGIVFNVGHPVADAGDDRAAGPIMELVVEFWPNHYMALYHAGAARYALGEPEAAAEYLRDFLATYPLEDGWTASARSILQAVDP